MSIRKPKEKTQLDVIIDNLEQELTTTSPTDENYPLIMKQLIKARGLRDANRRQAPSTDTMLMVGGNILVTAMIVGYERTNVITTKALSFLPKFR